MPTQLAQTPLYSWHAAQGGRMVDFAGWSMPVQYSSIMAEHHATRTAVGLFDVSHMARFRFRGPAAEALLNRLVTRDISELPLHRICYALIVNESGGILDDVLVYHLDESALGHRFQLVVNASNRAKIWQWIAAQRRPGDAVDVADVTDLTTMIAVQGPAAGELLRSVSADDPGAMKYYCGGEATIMDIHCLLSRTGYTGEDGWEIVAPAASALELWHALLERGHALGVVPAGLGCRDTLRLEAAMPLYGHELTEDINPFQAGLRFAVELDKHEFVGRQALQRLRDNPTLPHRVGLEIGGERPAREGHSILHEGRVVGRVTSGTTSPTLKRPIAMGYIEPALAAPGTQLSVDIRGQQHPARVVKLPFYRRPTQNASH